MMPIEEPRAKKAKTADISTLQSFEYKEPKVIAEIGCNHKGELDIAKELLSLAKECGATVGKFQKRTPKELLTPEQYAAPHPNPQNSYGDTYGAHREALELSVEDHKILQEHCRSIGLDYSCSVWDTTAARDIISLNPPLIKVGSPSNTHWEMQEVLREEYDGEIHISTGMSTKEEIEKIVSFWEQGKGRARERLVLYNCTSGYPVPFEDVCLLDIRLLQQKYAHRVKAIGFSGHHLGIAIDIAAYALGAEWSERHFTKDRTWKGTDHAASLEPAGLSKLCRDLKATYTAMSYKSQDILPLESQQRAKLKWGQYNAELLQKGTGVQNSHDCDAV
jgi:N-acetylneuraminate synthase